MQWVYALHAVHVRVSCIRSYKYKFKYFTQSNHIPIVYRHFNELITSFYANTIENVHVSAALGNCRNDGWNDVQATVPYRAISI